MTRDIIDKCLDFAEGNKGKFTILTVKKPNFPDTLIEGTERQRIINGYIEQGYSTRHIAELMGRSQPTIVEHIGQYKKSVAFYSEWCEFWEFITEVRQTPVEVAFCGILQDDETAELKRKKINTVGDFIHLSVTMSTTQFYNKINTRILPDAKRKAELFGRIKQMCCDLLPE